MQKKTQNKRKWVPYGVLHRSRSGKIPRDRFFPSHKVTAGMGVHFAVILQKWDKFSWASHRRRPSSWRRHSPTGRI